MAPSALPAEAQTFLVSYKALLNEMTESEATAAAINLVLPELLRENGRGLAQRPIFRRIRTIRRREMLPPSKRPPVQRPRTISGFESKSLGFRLP